MIKNKEQSNRAGLTMAVIGLSITTVIVLVVGFFFVSSLMLWRQPESVVAADLVIEEVEGGETAVSPNNTPVFEEPATLTPRPTQLNIGVEEEVVEETAVEINAVSPTPTAFFPTQLENEQIVSTGFGELIIPSLNVTQLVTTVPLQNGQWDISQLNADVGHLTSTGTHPGDDLAMTFVGHVTLPWPNSGPFADLILLKHGEEVIYRWNGLDYIYQVERIFRAHPSNVDLLYEEDGDKINLVTCSGWDFLDGGYAERLVTRAVLVRTEPSPVMLEQ